MFRVRQLLGRFRLPHNGGVYSLTFSPDGSRMAMGGVGSIVRELNIEKA